MNRPRPRRSRLWVWLSARVLGAPADHGYLIKIVAAVLLVTLTVAIIAPLGWAILPFAIAIVLAISAAVLHATLRLLNETEESP